MNRKNRRKPAGSKPRVVLFSLFIAVCSLSCINGWMDELWARFDKEEAEEPKDPYVLIPVSQLTYTTDTDGKITIDTYNGQGGKVEIPAYIDGQPVTDIADGTNPNGVFQNKGLTGVVIPNSVTTIGQWAFSFNSSLTSVTIPNSVTLIGSNAFRNNQLTGVTIPNSATTIGTYAFANNQLRSVTIGNSVTAIGDAAFYNNQLTSVTIPADVSIGNTSFQGNPITSITFMGSGVMFTGSGNAWIDNVGNLVTLYQGVGGGAGTYTRPDTTSTNWAKQ